jgi:hypothetical protein
MAFCIIIDLFMAYKYPISDVFHWFCKIARFFATEPGIGYPYMELIAGVCPRHGIKAVIHVDKSKNFDYLRDLFHMTTATSGLCAECAKELKQISAGER